MSLVNSFTDFALYPVGDASYITQLSPGTVGQDGTWIYGVDAGNGGIKSARILRINVLTGMVEEWLPGGVLPVGPGCVCFTHDFSAMLFCSIGDDNIYLINYASKVPTLLGALSKDYYQIVRIPNGKFILFPLFSKNLDLVTISPFNIELNAIISNGFSGFIDSSPTGEVYRMWQKGGPGASGPIYHTIAGQLALTQIDAGQINGVDGPNFGPAHSSSFKANTVAWSPDGIYFTIGNSSLNVISGGSTSQISPGSGGEIIGYSQQHNVLVMRESMNGHLWSYA